MKKITESPSSYRHLEQMPVRQLLQIINQEDQRVPLAVAKAIPAIEACVSQVSAQMQQGGRLFYIGAGTSGRLGILDASECPPTFGVPDDWVIGLIAGGDTAIRSAVEFAEDDADLAWEDLQQHHIHALDFVVGIAASGTTPYVVHGLEKCQKNGIRTAAIFCNPNAPISQFADYPIEVVVGSEVVTGSTRMKAGTAQKLVLNMISTSIMIQLGRVVDNRMVDMQMSNQKLLERGTRMLMESLQIDQPKARQLLQQHGSVRKAIEAFKQA